MRNLRDYINKTPNHFDAHIHLFSSDKVITDAIKLSDDLMYVGFMDTEFAHLDQYTKQQSVKYYDNFIKNHYDKNKMILLATGITSKEIIQIYKNHPKEIKGFGELKIYKQYNGYKVPNRTIWDFKELFEFDRKKRLPIYIHKSLEEDNDVEELCKVLSSYPEIPFVLCHCGITKGEDYDQIQMYERTRNLLYSYNNLHADISYAATPFFLHHPELLRELPQDKLLVGSDVNPYIIEWYDNDEKKVKERFDKELNDFKKLNSLLNCDKNVKKLFNI